MFLNALILILHRPAVMEKRSTIPLAPMWCLMRMRLFPSIAHTRTQMLHLFPRKILQSTKQQAKATNMKKCGRLHLKAKNPELRIDRLKDIPEGVIAIEVDQAVARKLFGQTIAIRCYDNTVEHTVGEVNGSYWFKVDIGSQEGESNYEEEP